MSDAARQLHRARALRRSTTPAERALWRVLSSIRPRFTRQLPIAGYFADIACRRARVVVEIDGSQHVDNADDVSRSAILEAAGWRVLRFWNPDVLANPASIAEAIIAAAEPRLPPGESFEAIAPRAGRARKARTRKKEEPPPTPPRSRGGEPDSTF